MVIKEENLSDDAKAVLAIVREEALAGRLTQKQEQLLNRAIALQESIGVIGRFIVWFAGLLIAVSTVWSYAKVWWRS